jgi:RNA polymerase sigma-70 factor, ECF subfamily
MTQPRARMRSFEQPASLCSAAVERGPRSRWCHRGRRAEWNREEGFGVAGVATAGGADQSAAASNSGELDLFRRKHRTDLSAYCYRMLGSMSEAEDAVQETLLRAWKSIDRFEGRAPLSSWLYQIATNVCRDILDGMKRRARPMDFGPAQSVDVIQGDPLPEVAFEPVPRSKVLLSRGDPAELVELHETIRHAFVAALQHLPPRQRAVLILRDVLQWSANEVAELLGTTVASVTSALQRDRARLANGEVKAAAPSRRLDGDQKALLARYVAAFESYDVELLTDLLREDATRSMQPSRAVDADQHRRPQVLPRAEHCLLRSAPGRSRRQQPPAFGAVQTLARKACEKGR